LESRIIIPKNFAEKTLETSPSKIFSGGRMEGTLFWMKKPFTKIFLVIDAVLCI